MAATPGLDATCAIARSLALLGDRWTMLIVRECFWGRSRFSDIRARLGLAPDLLSSRLARLVDAGVLTRRPYRENGGRGREEYQLTEAGEELKTIIFALGEWGDRHLPVEESRTPVCTDPSTGGRVRLAFVAADGTRFAPADVHIRSGDPVDATVPGDAA
ncbi:helix-turn-helix domain-containing protein [Micromonospora sp. NPDC049559]|uniref:winged helix-turn-helix transcriptional regulator n=1 Tax=Micromonospora sp. NPDC049559 TaxID=3155923 RepID=UPI00341E7B1F